MHRKVVSTLLALAVLAALPVAASGSHRDGGKKRFELGGEVRSRWEYLSNYLDAQDHTDATLDDDFDYWPYRARIRATGILDDNISGVIELQTFGFFGDTFSLFEPSADPLSGSNRIGAVDKETDLYQGYVQLQELFGSSWSLRVGRQEHTLGHELHLGDADFYNGRSFDGVRAMTSLRRTDLSVFYYVIEADRFNFAQLNPFGVSLPPFDDDDVNLSGVTAEISLRDGQTVEPYVLFLRDGGFNLGDDRRIYTFGALYGRSVDSRKDVERNSWDWSAELALQAGEVESSGVELDLKASLLEASVGYNWIGRDDSLNRVHAGLFAATGDGNAADGEVESFVPLFPDPHAGNRLGDLDLLSGSNVVTAGLGTSGMSNVTDLSLGYNRSWKDRHSIMTSLHSLYLSEEFQAGVTENAIGIELDVAYRYAYSRGVSFQGGVAQLSPGDALDQLTQAAFGTNADNILRAWGQLQLHF